MKRKGTDNSQMKEIVKDRLKQLFFFFSFKKYSLRKKLYSNISDLERADLCEKLIGMHQSYIEIIGFLNFVKKVDTTQKIFCEIGTANGGTSLFLASSLPSIEKIICIDLYVKNKAQLRFYLKGKNIEFIQKSSYDNIAFQGVQKIIGNRNIDLLFIDGDHSYSGVSKDLQTYLPLTHSKSIIGFHDIKEDHYTRFGSKTMKWAGDVPKFWNELKLKISSYQEWYEYDEQDGQGIGAFLAGEAIDKD